MGLDFTRCPVCMARLSYQFQHNEAGVATINCVRCGKYQITEEATYNLIMDLDLNGQQQGLISSWIRENQQPQIDSKNLDKLLELSPPTVGERANRLLLHIAKNSPQAGKLIELHYSKVGGALKWIQGEPQETTNQKAFKVCFDLLAVSWSSNHEELTFLIAHYLDQEKQYIDRIKGEGDKIRITPKGWAHIEHLQSTNQNSTAVFIARRFNDKVGEFHMKYVETAIEAAGYEPRVVNRTPDNDLVDSQILSLIKTSKFIIADFTYNNRGVYYEAGYAQGLGIEVIRICHEDHFDKEDDEHRMHFDQNHYPIILYQWNGMTKLGKPISDVLKERIIEKFDPGNTVKTN